MLTPETMFFPKNLLEDELIQSKMAPVKQISWPFA